MKSANHRSSKVGLPPGSLVYIGKERNDKVDITLYSYNSRQIEESCILNLSDYERDTNKQLVKWINIDGLHDTNIIEQMGHKFNLHPLLLEDVLNTNHRPKIEIYDDYIFLTFKMLGLNENKVKINYEQVSLVLGEDYVISFQERQGDIFDPIRERLRVSKGKLRTRGADYLAYRLMDVVVDNYFYIIDHIGEQIELLERESLAQPNQRFLHKVQRLKRELIFLRKAVIPLRDLLGSMEKEASDMSAKYFKDVQDHTVHIIENIEVYRDMLMGLVDTYMSWQSNKMNEVMKVLTIMASIFIPLTFIAGIYGMNFEHMPELSKKWGYPTVWAVMIATALGMIIYFKRKKWF